MRASFILAACSLACAAGSASAAEGPAVIRNEFLEVRCDRATGRVSLVALPSKRTFVKDAKLREGGKVGMIGIEGSPFGNGKGIAIAHRSGSDVVAVFPGVPFALSCSTLYNGGKEATNTEKVNSLSAVIDLGKAPADVRMLGTGGLHAPARNPGSYAWLAVADPQTRNGVVGGWLSFDRGSGVVFGKEEDGQIRLDAQIDYGRLRVAPRNSERLEHFAIGYFDDARLGLEAWADAVAKWLEIKLPPQPVGYCTWYHAGASNEKQIVEQAEFAAKHLKPFGFSVVQIDDGWQDGVKKNGPKKVFSRAAEKGPYPHGMKPTAEAIAAQGLVAGLWFMPFAGTHDDPFFKEHQDWFVKRADGTPYDTAWGGTCLDMTHPAAREYLRENIARFRDWGYRYFKMDGMWTGTATKQIYVNDAYKPDGMGDAVFHDPAKTNIEAYRDGLKLIRETAGRDVFILGCCAPQNMRSYGGAFGLVDAMRIGPDNGPGWSGLLRGPTYGSRHYHLHGRIWYNDPDPVYVREKVPLEHARAICSWVAVTGQLNLSSEDFSKLPSERVDLLKRTMPSHGLLPRPVDLFDEPVPRIWLLSDTRRTPRRDVIGLFNWSDKPATIECGLDRIGLDATKEYVAFDYWQNALLPPIAGRLQIDLPAQSCRVLAVRPRSDRPQLLSTSRHITQGIVDVIEEKWDDGGGKTGTGSEPRREKPGEKVSGEVPVPVLPPTLAGRSRVVAGDPYELRIVLPADAKWNEADAVVSVAVSPDDQAAGVKIAHKSEKGLLRVTIDSPASREVTWVVTFKGDGK